MIYLIRLQTLINMVCNKLVLGSIGTAICEFPGKTFFECKAVGHLWGAQAFDGEPCLTMSPLLGYNTDPSVGDYTQQERRKKKNIKN